MNLPDDAVIEFQEIYQREYKTLLSMDEARERAESFIKFMGIVAKPVPKDAKIKLYRLR